MTKSKIETYIGFCIRSRKILFGVDNIEKQRKGICLIIADEELGENSYKVLKKAKEKFDCPMLTANAGILGEHTYRPKVKAVAVTDKNLASAILSALTSEPQYKFYSGGND